MDDVTDEETQSGMVMARTFDGSVEPFSGAEGYEKTFEITEEVDLTSLQKQIEAALSAGVQMVLVNTTGEPISVSNPATLHVLSPDEFDGRTVRGAITSHVVPPPEDEDVDALIERLRDGEVLSLDLLSAVVRSLV